MADLSLSICIIVKDEAKYLHYSIESVTDIASEIIIINSQGPGPLFHPLREGGWGVGHSPSPFTLHSSPHCDWLLVMDSGTIFSEESKGRLPGYLKNKDVSLYYLKCLEGELAPDKPDDQLLPAHFEMQVNKDIFAETAFLSLVPCLTRNVPGIPGNLNEKVEIADLYIKHYFYTKELNKAENESDKILLKKAIQENSSETGKLFLRSELLSREIALARLFAKQLRFRENKMKPEDKADHLFLDQLKKWHSKNNAELKNKILELYNDLAEKPAINSLNFENWFAESTGFLISDLGELSITAGLLDKIMERLPLSLNILFNYFLLFSKTEKFYESLKILDFIAYLVENNYFSLKPGIKIRNRYLNPDYISYLRAVTSYQAGNYEAFEFYKKQIINQDIYYKKFAALKLSGAVNKFNLAQARKSLSLRNFPEALQIYIKLLDFYNVPKGEKVHIYRLLIICGLILSARELAIGPPFLNELIAEGNILGIEFPFFHFCLGCLYFNSGDPENARLSWEKARVLEEKNAQLQKIYIESHLEKPGLINITEIINSATDSFLYKEITVGLADFNKLPGIKSPGPEWEQAFSRGREYWQKNEFQKALEYFLAAEAIISGITSQESDYFKFILADYLTLAYERLNDFEKAFATASGAGEYFQDNKLKERAEFYREKMLRKIIRAIPPGLSLDKNEAEWLECLKQIAGLQPAIIVEVGQEGGGALYTVARLIKQAAGFFSIIPGSPPGKKTGLQQLELELLKANSNNEYHISIGSRFPDSLTGKKIDLLMINGRQSPEKIREAYEIFASGLAPGGLIIIDGILKQGNAGNYQTNDFWSSLINKNVTREIICKKPGEINGTGIIIYDRQTKNYGKYNIASINIFQDFMVNRAVYQDNIQLLAYCFSELGVEFTTSENQLLKGYNNILFQAFSNNEFNSYALDYSYMPYQMEPLFIADYGRFINFNRYHNYIRLLKNSARIWDYLEQNITYLNSVNINNAYFLPFGFHEKMQVLDFNKEKTIDILIYGALYNRRIAIFNELIEKGYNVRFLTNIYGKERNAYLEKARIILNINFSEKLSSEHRFSFLLNNACFIISEEQPEAYYSPYYEGIIFCPYEKISETCEFYLRPENDQLRQEIAEKGFLKFSQNKMVENLKKVLYQTF
jgi:hypothetical protein